MANFARIVNCTVVDVSSDPSSQFDPATAAQFAAVPDFAQVGWTIVNGVWSAPVAPPDQATCVIPASEFYACFTTDEAAAINASTDPLVQEFARLLQQQIAAGGTVDTAILSVQQEVKYLSITNRLPATSPQSTYIEPARVAQILAGQVQIS